MDSPKFKGKVFEVFDREVKRDGKNLFTAEIIRRPPGTRLIIVRGDEVMLTKEYRYEINEYDFRLPGGKVYDTLEEYKNALEKGVDIIEAAKDAAIKEASEEAGIQVKEIKFLQKSICGMTVEWELFYFLITDFSETAQHLEDDEDIEVCWFSREKTKEMCFNGEMKEDRSALVLLRYLSGVFDKNT
jgi:ADP-ribose pyrophosphatase